MTGSNRGWPAIQAEHFLYFENQYWLGGSGEWQSLEMANVCRHIVPVEIALKVSEKIMEGQPFAAYCVIPLFPEGERSTIPHTASCRSPRSQHAVQLHLPHA